MRQLRNTLFIAALLTPLFAGAQLTPEPIQFIVNPEVPGPGELVTIEAQGTGTYIGESPIAWTLDGKAALSGVGERTFSFTTGNVGSVNRVRVSIRSGAYGTIEREFVFRPSTVNLLWEADTTVPPFYQGKALYSAGSPLRVVAISNVVVNGARVAPASLSFQWRYKGEPVPQYSGLGRSAVSFDGDQLQPGEEIGVDVLLGGVTVARQDLFIPATPTSVALYRRDGLRGVIYDQALPEAVSLTAPEITLFSQPYFFTRSSQAQGLLSYAWALNGEEVTGPDSARGLLTLRQTGSGAGGAQLSASVQNNDPDLLVQTASSLLTIIFGQSASGSSFFGL